MLGDKEEEINIRTNAKKKNEEENEDEEIDAEDKLF